MFIIFTIIVVFEHNYIANPFLMLQKINMIIEPKSIGITSRIKILKKNDMIIMMTVRKTWKIFGKLKKSSPSFTHAVKVNSSVTNFGNFDGPSL